MIRKILTITIITFVLAICSIATAEIPHLINYQGKLTDSGGVPLHGSYDITFRIYNAESAGTMLWQEPRTQAAGTAVTINQGVFSIMLGSVTELTLAFDQPYWLSIQVGDDPEMIPRQQITSVGYAINAERTKGSENIFAGTGNVGIGTTDPQGKLDINGGPFAAGGSPGTAGQFLKTQGADANPVWSSVISAIHDYGTSTSTYATKNVGDLKICYGYIDFSSSMTVSVMNLPFSSSSSYVVTIGQKYTGGPDSWVITVIRDSGSQFTLKHVGPTGCRAVMWLAIGT